MKVNIINLIRNKSLRFRILLCITVAIILMVLSLFGTMRLDTISMKSLGESYTSSSELSYFTQEINSTEKAMETYVNYHTFEAIDNYYYYKNKVESFFDDMQSSPSKNEIYQKEYVVLQLAKSFLFYSDKTISARRANNNDEIETFYKNTIDCYNFLQLQIQQLNNLRLQQNALSYEKNQQRISLTRTLSFFFFIVLSVLIFLILYFTINSITEPLVDISNVAHKIAKRDFEIPLFNRDTNDEIGNICQAFDRMIISIREYIDTIWEKARTEAELKEKEIEMQALYTDAQLRALQNQINPHFLFNTLNTGAQLAMMENADKTCYFMEQVADFFRYNIQQQKKTATIDEELGLIDNFVYIMKVRFGNRLVFTKELPNEKFSEEIPLMTLQPLVENCIKHGLKKSKGIVKLTLTVEEKFIIISICDNGDGMSDETKEAVFQAVDSGTTRLSSEYLSDTSTHNGTGLISVFLRLKLHFHRDDLFDITNGENGKGTKFIIRIPKND